MIYHYLLIVCLLTQFSSFLQGNILNGWAVMTKNDLEAAYTILKENHPGYLEEKSYFNQWFCSGYQQALQYAEKADSYEKYLFTLYHFISGFQDSHLDVWPSLIKETMQWPGFTVRYETADDKFIVSFTSDNQETFPSLPPLHAELVSCDNIAPKYYLEKFIFPYYRGINNISAHYNKFAQNLLTDRGNPYVPRPSACAFKIENSSITLPLHWNEIQKKDFNTMILDNKPTLSEISLNSFMDGQGIWVSLPTFNPQTAIQQEKLEKIVELLKENRTKDFIVFDVRGNTGGYGRWFYLILKALFGEEYIDYISAQVEQKVYWRASESNIDHLENNILPHIKKSFGITSTNYKGTKRLISQLKREKDAQKLVLYRGKKPRIPSSAVEPLSTAKIYVVTDNECFSACLEFLDFLSQINNVVFLGLPTGVDTKYSNTRIVTLPSGILHMQFPIAMVQNRQRHDNIPYIPDQIFHGNIYDTEALKNWVASVIQNSKC